MNPPPRSPDRPRRTTDASPFGRAPRARARASGAALLLAAALLSACASAPPAATGSLHVTVTGLPDDVPARITVEGSAFGPVSVTEVTTLAGLPPGPYALSVEEACRTAGAICAELDRFVPAQTRFDVDVVAGQVRQVEVAYDCALLDVPDANLATALTEAIREQTGDPERTLSCSDVARLIEFAPGPRGIADLRGLEHALRLEVLVLDQNLAIEDLRPLEGLTTLRVLTLGGRTGFGDSLISDMTPVSRLPNLEELTVVNANVASLPDLSALTKLRLLDVSRNQIASLANVATLADLEILKVSHCRTGTPLARTTMSDLEPLRGLTRLRGVVLGCHAIADLEPLSGLPSLTDLSIASNQITDLTPLGTPEQLTSLFIMDNHVTSLGPIAAWPRLERLYAAQNPITDFRPVYLHRSRFATLEFVGLQATCVYADRVPTKGYVEHVRAAGVTVQTATSGLCVPDRPEALSTFEVDSEGWTPTGDPGAWRRTASGGSSGGAYLTAFDQRSGVLWYWAAPAHFLGDARDFLGGTLEVWLRQPATTSEHADTTIADIVLRGNGVTLTYRHDVTIGLDWTRVVIPLSTTQGMIPWLQGRTVADATTFESVLADLTLFHIRGEYRLEADSGDIGLVRIEAARE
jgi:hypothetical protein